MNLIITYLITDCHIIVGNFNALLSIRDTTTRQEVSKEMESLNTTNQLDPTEV